MRNKRALGAQGEQWATEWLTVRGFLILSTNWRHGRCEIDIIASRGEELHFVEVKTRSSRQYGLPEESVDEKKLMHLLTAGEAYQYAYPKWKRIQYDVLSVEFKIEGEPIFTLIEDVYL